MSYVTAAEFKEAVGVDDTVDDTNIQRALDAAATLIDSYCGRVFTAQDTSLSTRIFDPQTGSMRSGSAGSNSVPYSWFFGTGSASAYAGYDRLNVPDVASVTAIELDSNYSGTFTTSLPAGSWMLYPLTVGQPGSKGNYTQIRLRPNSSYGFYPGSQIRVTGLWGWPTADAPPAAVKQANILLANRYFRRPGAPFGVWEGPQLGQLAVLPQRDPDVVQLLEAYQSATAAQNWVMV